jgi:hypothetical protein
LIKIFFKNDQVVDGKLKRSDLLQFIFEKCGHLDEIVNEAFSKLKEIWKEHKVQQCLLALSSGSKRNWSNMNCVMNGKSKKIKQALPNTIIIRGRSFQMPNLFQAYKTIMKKVKIHVNINEHFKMFAILKEQNEVKRDEELKSLIEKYNERIYSEMVQQTVTSAGIAQNISSQIISKDKYQENTTNSSSYNKRKRINSENNAYQSSK